MRLGLGLWPNRDARQLAELAVAAESAGFDDVWWPDHYDLRECGAVLALSAARTTRIRIGNAVTSVLLRHPAILASLYATIDEISDGRAIAGLGPGGFELRTELHSWTKTPLAATREATLILRALLNGEPVHLPEAQVFPMTGGRLTFRPKGPIPIYLAARGPRMLELAGEVADGVITHGLSRAYIELTRQRVGLGTARSGRTPEDGCDIALMFHVALDPDVRRARELLRPHCLMMVGGEYAEELIPVYGLDPERVLPLRAAVRRRDRDAVRLIDDTMVDAFAIGGPAEHIAERLRELANCGADTFILSAGHEVKPADIETLGRALRDQLG